MTIDVEEWPSGEHPRGEHVGRLTSVASRPMNWTALVGLGAAIATQLAVFVVLGLVIDSLAGTAPVFTLIGVLLGVAVAIRFTVSTFRRYLSPDTGKTAPVPDDQHQTDDLHQTDDHDDADHHDVSPKPTHDPTAHDH